MSHTPGPWKFRRGRPWQIFAGGESIMGNKDYYPWVPQNKDDWRLIAAAPELLSLLKRYRDETPIGHQPHMIAHEADTLIDKIEGK